MKRTVGHTWRLREIMAAQGVFTATELVPLLRDRGITLSVLPHGDARPRTGAPAPGWNRTRAQQRPDAEQDFENHCRRLRNLTQAIAPGVAAAPRTPGRAGEPSPAEQGYLHCGPAGAGHFVKMVHNGIEYGVMAAYAEGLNILHKADYGNRAASEYSAEETPLENPEHYRYDIDIAQVTEVWRRGSVVASWLLDLTAAQLHADPNLDSFGGRVSDSGEGRWTLDAAVDIGVPAPVLSAALFQRFASRGASDYADKTLSAMREAFGGHHELPHTE